ANRVRPWATAKASSSPARTTEGSGSKTQARTGPTAADAPAGPSRSVQDAPSGSLVARRRQDAAAPNQTAASLPSPPRLPTPTSTPSPPKCAAKSPAGPSLIPPPGAVLASDRRNSGPG